jgi:hypothetical protein
MQFKSKALINPTSGSTRGLRGRKVWESEIRPVAKVDRKCSKPCGDLAFQKRTSQLEPEMSLDAAFPARAKSILPVRGTDPGYRHGSGEVPCRSLRVARPGLCCLVNFRRFGCRYYFIDDF